MMTVDKMSKGRGPLYGQLGLQALVGVVVVLLLVPPSTQFTLIHRQQPVHPAPHGDATSVHGKLAYGDNRGRQASPHHHRSHQEPNGARFSTSDSAHSLSDPPPVAHTQPANSWKTNTRGNFQTSLPLGKTPRKIIRKPDAEASFNLKTREPTTRRKSKRTQAVSGGKEGRAKSSSSTGHSHGAHSSSVVDPRSADLPFTEVVEVEWRSSVAAPKGVEHLHTELHQEGRGQSDSNVDRGHAISADDVLTASSLAASDESHSLSLQQQVQQHTDDTHVSKMVLITVGSLTAIVGFCVMAAIFQCCCRRKRSNSPEDEKKEQEQKSARSSRSKSPSPRKVLASDEDGETDKGQSEQDKLLEEDEDLGDFSVVQRETEILRSYRKPPPPKNRARASRVPRAMKTLDPKASPDIFQELVDKEEGASKPKSPKAANGLASPDTTVSADMHSSMLDDIDSTLAAMHTTTDDKPRSTPSPTKSKDHSREPSAEKVLASKTDSDSSPKLRSPTKDHLSAGPSREELAKSLALELSRSLSKEMLFKPQSKSASPKSSKQTTPKSLSAGASPKVPSKAASPSPGKDSVGSSGSGVSTDGATVSPEEGEKKEPGNFFALIDPTAKDGDTGKQEKSKIPVRAAAANASQPTALLRPDSGKDKRFPVPSVHGDQMDQLLKSLKTRLKEDDGSNPKRATNKISSEGDSPSDEDLDPQGRDRSHSDPTKPKDKKKENLQTHL